VLLKIFFDYGEKRKRERSDPEGGQRPTAELWKYGMLGVSGIVWESVGAFR
jgi:hypothetical protein